MTTELPQFGTSVATAVPDVDESWSIIGEYPWIPDVLIFFGVCILVLAILMLVNYEPRTRKSCLKICLR